jgi:hypothetical protein
MEGNKLKHSFVEKDEAKENFLNEWIRLVNPRQSIQFIPEVTQLETLSVSELISLEMIRYNQNTEYLDYIKEEMLKKLGRHLLEEGFITVIEETRYDTSKTITMKIKAKKI